MEIKDILPETEILAQLAEEAAELIDVNKLKDAFVET